LATDPTRSPDELVALPTRDGRTVRQALADTVETLAVLASSLDRVLSSTPNPTISDVAGGAPTAPGAAAAESVPDLLAAVELWTMAIAERLDRAPSADLLRAGSTSTKTVSAIDVAREAVRVAAENLLSIENAIGRRVDVGVEQDEDA
jgi:hypothetical protein